jgi:colicin import membrane protein
MQQNGTAIVAYDEFRAQLAELREHNAAVVFDYEDPRGNKAARSHIHKLRLTKGAVEKVRKAEKAEALECGRQVDAQAKAIVAEIDGMIEVHQAPLDVIEQRERDRRAKHEANLERMRELGTPTNEPLTAAQLRERLADVDSYKLGAHWEEYETEAARLKEQARERLLAAIEQRETYEREQAELERLRREQAAREQAERDARIAAEAADKARREAEEKAQREREAAEAAARAERQAAERRELQLRLEKEQAERAAAEAEQRAMREQEELALREQAEAEKREQNRRHAARVHRQAVAGFVENGIDEETAKRVMTLIAKRMIPRVAITY